MEREIHSNNINNNISIIIQPTIKPQCSRQLLRNIHPPTNRGTPTALKSSKDNFQLAQINIVQQAFKEQEQRKILTVQ
jgi:hypothetical protein